jgi:hypothetical protein
VALQRRKSAARSTCPSTPSHRRQLKEGEAGVCLLV